MVWIPLLSALLGALIGSATTLVGQWLADRRVNGQFDVPAGGQVKVPTLCGMF